MLEVPQFIFDRAVAKTPVFTEDEVRTWPDELFKTLAHYDLIRQTDNASSVACDACGIDHVESVTKLPIPSGEGFRAYIICPQEGRVWVSLDRLRQWKLDVPKLCEMTGWAPPPPHRTVPGIDDPIRLSVADVAKVVGVSDRTIREWRANGKITVFEEPSGQLCFSKSELEIFRQSRR